MESNSELLILFPELRHGLFAAKIKKPMKSYFHASSNDISMNALNTIVANDMENSKLGEAGFDEHDIFSPPSIEEKIFFDDTLPPIYDDYNDSGLLVPPTMESKVYYDYTMPPTLDENNNDSYFVEFAPTTSNKIDYAYVESNDTFMHVNKNALCDTYIVEFVHDASENYYEREKYGCRNFHVTKTRLYMLKFLKLHLFYLSMLVALCFMNLFIYKIPMHRKHFRIKCVLNLPLYSFFCFGSYFLRVHHLNF